MTKKTDMLLGCNKGFPYMGFSDVKYIKKQDIKTTTFIDTARKVIINKHLSSDHVRNLSEAIPVLTYNLPTKFAALDELINKQRNHHKMISKNRR